MLKVLVVKGYFPYWKYCSWLVLVGVGFDSKLNFADQCHMVCLVYMYLRRCHDISELVLRSVILCISVLRVHIEYVNSVYNAYREGQIKPIKNVWNKFR